ncbi:MAG: sigma-70 family RNA polymerase sigma factor [Gemmatimonadota bacterium]
MGAVPLTRAEITSAWDELDIRELVAQAQTGDALAFEGLYRRLVGRIYALCLRMARDAQRAEELTQDVFVRAWERLGTFRGESRFTTWLHRLAVNVVLQEGRTKGRRESREELVEAPDEYLTRVKVEFPGTRLDLERAIASLPDGARTVVILRDIYGYKYDEIAEMQGVAVGTVKAQIHRARKMMRERLDR